MVGFVRTDHDRVFIAKDSVSDREADFPTLVLAFEHVEKAITREYGVAATAPGTCVGFRRPHGEVVKWEVQTKLSRS